MVFSQGRASNWYQMARLGNIHTNNIVRVGLIFRNTCTYTHICTQLVNNETMDLKVSNKGQIYGRVCKERREG